MRKSAFALMAVIILVFMIAPCVRNQSIAHAQNPDPPVFSDGFETGDFSAWTSQFTDPGNTIEVIAAAAHSGSYGLHAINTGSADVAITKKVFADSYTALYERVYVYMLNIPTETDGYTRFFDLRHDSIQDFGCGLMCDGSGNYEWFIHYPSEGGYANSYSSRFTPSSATWYCLEIQAVVNETVGQATMYANGVAVINETGLNTGTNPLGATEVGIGLIDDTPPASNVWYGSSYYTEVYEDDVAVNSSYIGPESGGTTPPTYSSISANTTIANQPCSFSCFWTDETGLAFTGGYIFETNNTGTFTNDTWTAFSTDPQWANATKTLNDTVGNVVSYLWYANDTGNRWNSTDQYNLTVTAPPPCEILSPTNTTYATPDVPLTFITNEVTSWMGYSLDGQGNVTIIGNTTLTGLSDGSHNVIVYVNDSLGNMGSSLLIHFEVSTTAPSIVILSPLNGIYATTDLPLTFSVNESTSWIGYSLDGLANVTISGNTTLTGLSEGSHTVLVYADGTAGKMSSSETVDFTVELEPAHDVAIAFMIVSKTAVDQGYCLNVSIDVGNNGESAETFNVTAYANQTIIDEIYNVNLTSGDGTILSFIWNTTGFSYGNYTISAYAWPVPGETYTINNNFTGGVVTVTIPGDINGDFKVSLADLVLLANAYGTTPASGGTPETPYAWNPNADIDGNGVVGLSDLVILAINYPATSNP